MSKRRRGAVDDSGDSDSASEADHEVKSEQSLSDAPSDPEGSFRARSRRRRLRRDPGMESEGDDHEEDAHWPIVLKTHQEKSEPLNGTRRNQQQQSEDEYVEPDSDEDEESASDAAEDEGLEYSDGGFVVDSDDNLVSSYGSRRKRSRRPRVRTRAHKVQRRSSRQRGGPTIDDSDDSFSASDGSIAEELRELRRNDSPARRGRNYRVRPPVDYTIPPPPTVEEIAQAAERAAQRINSTTNTGRSRGGDSRVRRLFDVSGPFGGNDVDILFETDKNELQSVLETDASSSLGATSISEQVGAGNVATAAKTADVDPIDVGEDIDFSSVGGLDGYIAKLKEMVSLPLLYPELYEKFGITPPRGVLFHGPPGTGKTLMARALAASHREEKVTFYMRKGADVLSKWIGESERQLRALFDEARANQPSIIFFDEIDGLAPVRSAKQEQHHASIVSTLLALMDGMDNRGQVVVIGATNRPDSVDPALRRPGRFDREFYFPLPDYEGRQRILEIHTRKWSPPPSPDLIADIARQTKGYGGADLRALTTEAALLSIQRAYPQIYSSSVKLEVDSDTIEVRPQDFAIALEKIQPSTARAAGTTLAQPLPARISPLLRPTFSRVSEHIAAIFPTHTSGEAQAALFLDDKEFLQAREVSQFAANRVHRPRLLLQGPAGNGQGYLIRAIANLLEGVYVRELSVASLFDLGTLQPESAIVGAIAEARQRAPSCVMLPNIGDWLGVPHLSALLLGLLRSLLPSEQVLIVATANSAEEGELSSFFQPDCQEIVLDTSAPVILRFFSPILDFITRTPLQCREASELPRPQPPKLAEVPVTPKVESVDLPSKMPHKSVFSEAERRDLRILSQLKLKLGVLLDGFRQRYRRFRKPVIDEQRLVYLFDRKNDASKAPAVEAVETVEAAETTPAVVPEETAEPTDDDSAEQYVPTSDNMILDRETGKKYFNMDLETVEDRLWNGYYFEAQQFLSDIEMIYKDSVVFGDRERMHKASEMLANAQVAVDDIIVDKQFAEACHSLRVKDARARLSKMQATDASLNIGAINISEENHQELTANGDIHSYGSTQMPLNGAKVKDISPAEKPNDEMIAENNVPGVLTSEASRVDSPKYPERIVYSPEKLRQFQDVLISSSRNLTLEELEQLSAVLSDIVWKRREDWNRDLMLDELLLLSHTLSSKDSTREIVS